MTCEIPLTRGYVALVDDEDYEHLTGQGKWCVSVKKHTQYALRGVKKPDGSWTTIRMHNVITGWDRVDHVNRNGLDNRRANLRPTTHALNAANTATSPRNTTGYRGVIWHKAAHKWMAQLGGTASHVYLGLYDTAEEAAIAYDLAAAETWGDHARLNFPKEHVA